jgi:hypothetical protein
MIHKQGDIQCDGWAGRRNRDKHITEYKCKVSEFPGDEKKKKRRM